MPERAELHRLTSPGILPPKLPKRARVTQEGGPCVPHGMVYEVIHLKILGLNPDMNHQSLTSILNLYPYPSIPNPIPNPIPNSTPCLSVRLSPFCRLELRFLFRHAAIYPQYPILCPLRLQHLLTRG